MIKDLFHFPQVSTTPVVNLELRIFEKNETALLVYSGAWGKLIHEKNKKSKISGHCPFKSRGVFLRYSEILMLIVS
jgi:hypothetical protein